MFLHWKENVMAWIKTWKSAFRHKAGRAGLKNSQWIFSQPPLKGQLCENSPLQPTKKLPKWTRMFQTVSPLQNISSKFFIKIKKFAFQWNFFSEWFFYFNDNKFNFINVISVRTFLLTVLIGIFWLTKSSHFVPNWISFWNGRKKSAYKRFFQI